MELDKRSRGFTYVGVLILLSTLGLTAAVTVRLGETMKRRDAEQALLKVGESWIEAFDSYAMTTPPGKSGRPRRLEDLLRDPRTPSVVRHLRRLPFDPVARSEEWGIVRARDGSIIGVYSLAQGRPIKISGFETTFEDFDEKTSYRAWRFMGPVLEQTDVKDVLNN
jgi:type II secretory pathway pseudopilin PulG